MGAWVNGGAAGYYRAHSRKALSAAKALASQRPHSDYWKAAK